MKFVGLVGSNYDQSYNRKLLEFIRRQFKIKFELEVLEIDEVPMFNQDEKWDESFQLRLLYNKITRADGVIIATPEHVMSLDHSRKHQQSLLVCFQMDAPQKIAIQEQI